MNLTILTLAAGVLIPAATGFLGWFLRGQSAAQKGQPAPPLPPVGQGGIISWLATEVQQHRLMSDLAAGLGGHLVPAPVVPAPVVAPAQPAAPDLSALLGLLERVVLGALQQPAPTTTAAPK